MPETLPWLRVIGMALAGGVLGGLLAVLADILPYGPAAAWRACPSCAQTTWFSLLRQMRRCWTCGYWGQRVYGVALFSAALSAFLAVHRAKVSLVWLWPWTLYLLLISLIDIRQRVVLSEWMLVGLLWGVAFGVARRGWLVTLAGAAAGALLMGLLYLVGRLLQTHLQAGEEPLGLGDVLLMSVLGAVLGWPGIVAGLLWGILLAGGFSVLLVAYWALRYRSWPREHYVPYVPFLALAAWGLLL